MAARTTRQGASARAGRSTSTARSTTRRAPARASGTRSRTTTTRKAATPKPARRSGFPVLPVSVVVALVLLGWFLYPVVRLHYSEQRNLQRLQAQLAQIESRNQKLKREVDSLKTPQGVEAAAHDLGLARPGEQVWITMPEGGKPSKGATRTVSTAGTVAADPWTQILDAVFGVSK